MLFLGIDQHARQLTVSLRDQQGDVLLARQVSTRPAKILQFFDQLTQRCVELNESLIAFLEVKAYNRELGIFITVAIFLLSYFVSQIIFLGCRTVLNQPT